MKFDKIKVMQDIILGKSNKYLEEEYLHTTLTQPAISKLRSEYKDFIINKAEYAQLSRVVARRIKAIEEFRIKYNLSYEDYP